MCYIHSYIKFMHNLRFDWSVEQRLMTFSIYMTFARRAAIFKDHFWVQKSSHFRNISTLLSECIIQINQYCVDLPTSRRGKANIILLSRVWLFCTLAIYHPNVREYEYESIWITRKCTPAVVSMEITHLTEHYNGCNHPNKKKVNRLCNKLQEWKWA